MAAAKTLGHLIPLSSPWRGVGPFIFASNLVDYYPVGGPNEGPDPKLLKGRNIGMDMSKPTPDGFAMYHGDRGVPGFPAHPHRGFETVSLTVQGFIDHGDSTGACVRYGPGDVQWVTAGRGVSHSEMFPLVHQDKPNTFEMYQIWLNLPAKTKLSPPEFKMIWNDDMPIVTRDNGLGTATVRVIAGKFDNVEPRAPPENSYASDPNGDVAIWLINMEPRSSLKLPGTNNDKTERILYVHGGPGSGVNISGTVVTNQNGFQHTAVRERLTITNGPKPSIILVLQGVPLGEPVAQQGPFVMNTQKELQEGFAEYQRTQFGGWPWPNNQPIFAANEPRFAKHGDGRVEEPDGRKPSMKVM